MVIIKWWFHSAAIYTTKKGQRAKCSASRTQWWRRRYHTGNWDGVTCTRWPSATMAPWLSCICGYCWTSAGRVVCSPVVGCKYLGYIVYNLLRKLIHFLVQLATLSSSLEFPCERLPGNYVIIGIKWACVLAGWYHNIKIPQSPQGRHCGGPAVH